jgi:hypothetical protein
MPSGEILTPPSDPHDRDQRATPPSHRNAGRYHQAHQRDPRAGHLSTFKLFAPERVRAEALDAVVGAAE